MAAAAKKNSRPFSAKFAGTCSITGQRFQAGAQVQFVNDRIALVPVVGAGANRVPFATGTKTAPRQVAAKTVQASAPKAVKAQDAGSPGRRPHDERADGRCGWCRTVSADACPMCGWKRYADLATVAQPAPQVVLTIPAPRTVTVVTKPTGALKAKTLDALRLADAQDDRMTMTALAVALTDLAWKDQLADELAAMDARSAAQGWISAADQTRRAEIWAQAIANLGYDPRTVQPEQAPAVSPKAHAAIDSVARQLAAAEVTKRQAKQLGAGNAEPLKAGDWKGLWLRVADGSLTEDDAKAFGQLWLSQGL